MKLLMVKKKTTVGNLQICNRNFQKVEKYTLKQKMSKTWRYKPWRIWIGSFGSGPFYGFQHLRFLAFTFNNKYPIRNITINCRCHHFQQMAKFKRSMLFWLYYMQYYIYYLQMFKNISIDNKVDVYYHSKVNISHL